MAMFDRQVYFGCDTGEAEVGLGRDREIALLPYVSAVSIACGGHAGDEDSMRESIEASVAHDCILGAHPSYPDREGFGRQAIDIERDTLEISLRDQLSVFSRIADECDAEVSFIKAHGALYHTIARDSSFARWYWAICTSIFPRARFVGPVGSSVLEEFREAGIPVFAEGFCDRVYESDGMLRSRSASSAYITEPQIAAEQAERLIKDTCCDLLCVHSDSENSIEIAKGVYDLIRSGISKREGDGGGQFCL